MLNPGWLLIAATTVLPALLSARAAAQATAPLVEVRVDGRVELMSIVFRLAGHPEYNQRNSRSPYSEAVAAHFQGFSEHPVVQRARELRRTRGVSFDAVMSMAVHLELDEQMIPSLRVLLVPRPPQLEGRWTQQDATAFVELLAAFAKDADFKGFMESQADYHARAAEALSHVVNRQPIIPWFDRFFGARSGARYVVYAGLLNGGANYGVSFRSADGSVEEITPVIGIYQWSDAGLPQVGQESLDTIVHEFCHPYANAAIDRFADELDSAGGKLFAANRAVMQRMAYGSGRTVLYESLVRACVVRYMADQHGDDAAAKQAQAEVQQGFKWTPALAELLAEYEGDRQTYPAFDDFMPRVVEFFAKLAAEVAAAPQPPTVVSMEPANGARGVDPATAELVITFDRPMRDKSWAIVQREASQSPQFDQPRYDEQRRVLRVPMKLEPGRTYRFWLNAGQFTGFASEEGVPLESVEVTFTTAQQ